MTTEETLPEVLSSRLVAFLDILGFSERLTTMPLLDLHREYSTLIDYARTTGFGTSGQPGDNFAYAQFLYDSVVIVSHPLDRDNDGPKSVFKFVAATLALLEQAFRRRMPLRGAIGLADFLHDPDRAIFLSPIFPALVNAERLQEWCGVLVLSNAVDAVFAGIHGVDPSVVPASPSNMLLPYDVLMKQPGGGSCRARHWCLNWVWFSDAPVLSGALDWLREPKRSEVRAFIDHVASLPGHGQQVEYPAPLGAVVAARIQMCRAGMRLKQLDAAGCGADPPPGTPINIRIEGLVDGTPG
jgi:hypothetical protein